MKPKVFKGTALLLFLVIGLVGITPRPISAAPPKGREIKALRAYFSGQAQQKQFSGSVAVAEGGKLLFAEGFGIADYSKRRPNQGETLYAIASLGKAFTALSIMILEERGLLNIDDPLSLYLPEYPRGDEITLRQLLNMTAGVHDFFGDPLLWSRLGDYHTPLELLQYFIDDPLDSPPGASWNYCNSCYILLGVIIEQVSGQNYRDFLRENILGPLHMRHTSYDPSCRDFRHLKAVGYENIQTCPPPLSLFIHPTIPYAAGGIFSNVTDMIKWAESFKSTTLVSKKTLSRIFTPGLGNYGFGWLIEKLPIAGNERTVYWHWGSYLGYHSFIALLPEIDVSVVLLLNYSSPNLADRYLLLPHIEQVVEILLK